MNNLDELIEKYVESVIIHGKESWGGDHKKANKHFKIYTKCFIDICKHGMEGEKALKKLLIHGNYFVRCTAAYHILPFDSDIGIKMLKSCKSDPEGVGFNAKTIISEWNSGNLKFPVEKEGRILYVSSEDFLVFLNQKKALTQ